MKSKILLLLIIIVAIGAVYSVFFRNKPSEDEPETPKPNITIQTLNNKQTKDQSFDETAHTEGLEFYKGNLYVSGGLNGKSFIAKYAPTNTSKALVKQKIVDSIFAEGITILNDTIYQLTYKTNIVILYNATSLQQIGTMPWKYGEGWGLTNNGIDLIASNGTNIIFFLNPKTMEQTKSINVNNNGTPVDNINELEYVNGFIYANHFTTDYIYKIDANTGSIVAMADFKNLLTGYDAATLQQSQGEKYLNGIAYNPESKSFFITGKNWPKIFEVKF